MKEQFSLPSKYLKVIDAAGIMRFYTTVCVVWCGAGHEELIVLMTLLYVELVLERLFSSNSKFSAGLPTGSIEQ